MGKNCKCTAQTSTQWEACFLSLAPVGSSDYLQINLTFGLSFNVIYLQVGYDMTKTAAQKMFQKTGM